MELLPHDKLIMGVVKNKYSPIFPNLDNMMVGEGLRPPLLNIDRENFRKSEEDKKFLKYMKKHSRY